MNAENTNIDVNKIVEHWIQSSDADFETALKLQEANSFSWALFIGHISLEKILKAYYTKVNKQHAPFTHNLYRLAELSNLEISETFADMLDQITTFNINARYDDYKRNFYIICTKEYTDEWLNNINTLRKWIKEKL